MIAEERSDNSAAQVRFLSEFSLEMTPKMTMNIVGQGMAGRGRTSSTPGGSGFGVGRIITHSEGANYQSRMGLGVRHQIPKPTPSGGVPAHAICTNSFHPTPLGVGKKKPGLGIRTRNLSAYSKGNSKP